MTRRQEGREGGKERGRVVVFHALTLAHLEKGSTTWCGPVSRCRCAGFISKRDMIVASNSLCCGMRKDSSNARRERGNSRGGPKRRVVRCSQRKSPRETSSGRRVTARREGGEEGSVAREREGERSIGQEEEVEEEEEEGLGFLAEEEEEEEEEEEGALRP